jgi:hypothetical protein
MSDVSAKLAEIEARRAERKGKLDEAKKVQACADLEAYDALEVEHGDENVASLEVERFVEGHPTFVVLKAPDGPQYKRFVDQVSRAVEKNNLIERRKAQDLLAESCWIYPNTPEARKAMLAAFPGLLVSIAVRATQLVEGKASAEGKG